MSMRFKPQNSPVSKQTWELLIDQTCEFLQNHPQLPDFPSLEAQTREKSFEELGYTFWNQELLDRIAARLQTESLQRWLEVAAGTGKWTLELCRRGVKVLATDSHAQAPERVRGYQRPIRYGDWVIPLSAAEAVACFQPDGILCAWPPLGADLLSHLLAGTFSGSEHLRLLVCIGDPTGPSELPPAGMLPAGWELECWPECEAYLIGFNDPPHAAETGSYSRLLIYRRRAADGEVASIIPGV